MAVVERQLFIRNLFPAPWRQFPNHFGGALSRPLVMPETFPNSGLKDLVFLVITTPVTGVVM